MDFEYFLASLNVGKIDFNHPVKASRSGECIVESILAIGSRQHNDRLMTGEAVHFN